MSRINDATEEPAGSDAGRTLWRRSHTAEMPDDETGRFLDFAALADGMLDDEDEHDRVAAFVAGDPAAASDVAAARAISTGGIAMPGGLGPVIARAVALVDEVREPASVIPFVSPPAGRRVLHGVAQWGGLAAALAFAGWLGFSMGSGASLSLSAPGQPPQLGDGNFLPELLDPSTGFLRDLGEGQQT
jgi:anti-sigma factor RsiW